MTMIPHDNTCGSLPLFSETIDNAVLAVVASFFLYNIYWALRHRSNTNPKNPTLLWSAWIPFVGSGPELSRDSVAFTQKYHALYGSIFRTKLGLERAYFVKDVHFAARMSRRPDVYSMYKYFGSKTYRIFRIEFVKEGAVALHKWAAQHLISGTGLHGLMDRYSTNVRTSLLDKAANMQDFQVVNLFDFTNQLVFYSAARAFFGNYDSSLEENKLLEKTMEFDDWFVLIASGLVPELFLKKQRENQDFVGKYLSTALPREEMTELSKAMFSMIPFDPNNLSFLFAWALNANSLPSIFWLVLFLLRHEEIRGEIMTEVYDVLKTETGWDPVTATKFPTLQSETIQKMKLLRSFMLETLRVRTSVNLTRQVQKDTVVTVGESGEEYLLRKDWLVNCTNPHHDPSIFPEPEKLMADRFFPDKKHCDSNGKRVALPNMAFGHGETRCPGRNFALAEGPATAVMLLTCFDWEAVSPNMSNDNRVEAVPPPAHERFGFGCMPLHPNYTTDASQQFRVRVKPQFVQGKK